MVQQVKPFVSKPGDKFSSLGHTWGKKRVNSCVTSDLHVCIVACMHACVCVCVTHTYTHRTNKNKPKCTKKRMYFNSG